MPHGSGPCSSRRGGRRYRRHVQYADRGIVFAIELVMPVVSPLSLLCVAVSCITATYVGQSFFGVCPPLTSVARAGRGPGVSVSVLPWFVLFGLLLGVAAWAMTRGIYWFEDFFDSLPGNYYTRHMSGCSSSA